MTKKGKAFTGDKGEADIKADANAPTETPEEETPTEDAPVDGEAPTEDAGTEPEETEPPVEDEPEEETPKGKKPPKGMCVVLENYLKEGKMYRKGDFVKKDEDLIKAKLIK